MNIINFALTTFTPLALVLPKCIISYIDYFATDLGSKAFQLPFPAWYV